VALGLFTAHAVLEFLGRLLPASALTLTGQTWVPAEMYVAGAAARTGRASLPLLHGAESSIGRL